MHTTWARQQCFRLSIVCAYCNCNQITVNPSTVRDRHSTKYCTYVLLTGRTYTSTYEKRYKRFSHLWHNVEHCNTMPPRNGRHSPRRPQPPGVNPTDNRNFDPKLYGSVLLGTVRVEEVKRKAGCVSWHDQGGVGYRPSVKAVVEETQVVGDRARERERERARTRAR
jgi:hypothetical protein